MNGIKNFELLRKSTELDQIPGQYRIGLVALSNDYVTERDFMNMRPSDDVVVYTSRLRNTQECTAETLRKNLTETW